MRSYIYARSKLHFTYALLENCTTIGDLNSIRTNAMYNLFLMILLSPRRKLFAQIRIVKTGSNS